LDHLCAARSELLAAVQDLSAAEMTGVPMSGAWTVREILAHIGGWATWDVACIKDILEQNHPDLSVIRDVDAFNAALVAERQDWSIQQILAEMATAQSALEGVLGALPEETLLHDGRFRGPFWYNLAGWLEIAWEHELEHAAHLRTWRAMHT
jgi:uncharacterized damage-inducible protein DinB